MTKINQDKRKKFYKVLQWIVSYGAISVFCLSFCYFFGTVSTANLSLSLPITEFFPWIYIGLFYSSMIFTIVIKVYLIKKFPEFYIKWAEKLLKKKPEFNENLKPLIDETFLTGKIKRIRRWKEDYEEMLKTEQKASNLGRIIGDSEKEFAEIQKEIDSIRRIDLGLKT